MQQQILAELNRFLELKNHFKNTHPHYRELDTYGFSISPNTTTDIFFTGLTHGNEVIGIQIINLMLEEIKSRPDFNKKVAFMLNNIEAYKKNIRFIESDLNRSFCRSEAVTLEHKRAHEIENVLKKEKPTYVIDLHQTSEPSDGVFMMVPEDPKMIKIAHSITQKCPIVAYSTTEGFSSKGKTLGEFAEREHIIEVVFELGQKGFNLERAIEYKNLLIELDINQINSSSNESIEYLYLQDKVPLQDGHALIEDIRSLTPVTKDQILSRHITENHCFTCTMDAVVIFPRYKDITDSDTELALLAIKKRI
jgi:succinylglutamate desuccinylase